MALLWAELLAPPTDPPFGARRREASTRALADHGALKLRETANHLHHHTPGGSRSVDVLGDRAEPRPLRGDAFEQVEQILKRQRVSSKTTHPQGAQRDRVRHWKILLIFSGGSGPPLRHAIVTDRPRRQRRLGGANPRRRDHRIERGAVLPQTL